MKLLYNMSNTDKEAYRGFVDQVKEKVYRAEYQALKSVNKELIRLYWEIGQAIVDKQGQHGWGKSVVENLAGDLAKEFPGVKGFSVQNLWYMRQFYSEYQGKEKLQPLVGEISWSKHIVIIGKCNRTTKERAHWHR